MGDKFDNILGEVASDLVDEQQIEDLGKALGFKPAEIKRYIQTNMRFQDVTSRGTLKMLRDWNQGVRKAEERALLRQALEKAKLGRIADERLGETDDTPKEAAVSTSTQQGTEPCAECDTTKYVTEKQLIELAKHLHGDFYSDFATHLGFVYAEYDNIKKKNLLDIKQSTLEILHAWRDKTGGLQSELDEALEKAELAGLIHKYKLVK